MACEPITPAPKPPIQERFKYRLRFCKGDDLRLVSHHDLMHVCERLFRRAELPVAQTQGFHPTPRMIFALSLPLAVLGSNEVLELELTADLPEEELLNRMRRAAPPGLVFHNVRRIPLKTTAQVRRCFYRLPLSVDETDVSSRCETLLARDHLWMQRHKPYRRQVDIRPFLEGARADSGQLKFTSWMTPFGTAKPDEVLRLLGLHHLVEQGSVLERYDLELIDEAPADAPPVPLVDPKAIISTTMKDIAVPAEPLSREDSSDDAGSQRPTSLIEGPMSFET